MSPIYPKIQLVVPLSQGLSQGLLQGARCRLGLHEYLMVGVESDVPGGVHPRHRPGEGQVLGINVPLGGAEQEEKEKKEEAFLGPYLFLQRPGLQEVPLGGVGVSGGSRLAFYAPRPQDACVQNGQPHRYQRY